MRKEWFFDTFCGENLAVSAEDGKLTEFNVEDKKKGELVGCIVKGRVANVVVGMQAAFIQCGLERNGYLPLSDDGSAFSAYDGEGKHSEFTLKEGDEILVQIAKSPRGGKGAKLTRALSFVGKHLIYLPQTDFLGISRKITDEAKRTELLQVADKQRKPGEGYIIRTAAETATRRQFKMESEYLYHVYESVKKAAETAEIGEIIYRDEELPLKVMRDSLGGDVSKIYVGDRATYEKFGELIKLNPSINEKALCLYEGKRSIFAHFGLADQIFKLVDPRVDLEGGGYLVIDKTEAMTVIDVNTGGYTGSSDLETTVYETNLLAAREIARQVKLRNISGIVTVDFIDMTEDEHREAVTLELEKALAKDKAKSRVLPMNELCVSLFTRKRTNNGVEEFLLKPSTHYTRDGFVLSDLYMAMRIRSSILDYFADGYKAVVVELNRSLMNFILSEHIFVPELKTTWKDKRVYMVPHSTYHEEKYTIRGDNSGVLTLPDDAQVLY